MPMTTSELTIVRSSGDWVDVVYPPNATIGLGEHEVFIPAGAHKVVRWDGDVRLHAPTPRPARERLREALHRLVDRCLAR